MISNEAAARYLKQLDLSYIVTAMCATTYPLPHWQKSDAEACAALYKKFLWLLKLYPKYALVPTRDIDEFWHNHILYTKNYHRDCHNVFGFYLHHEPANPTEDPKKLIENYQQTKHFFRELFQQDLMPLPR